MHALKSLDAHTKCASQPMNPQECLFPCSAKRRPKRQEDTRIFIGAGLSCIFLCPPTPCINFHLKKHSGYLLLCIAGIRSQVQTLLEEDVLHIIVFGAKLMSIAIFTRSALRIHARMYSVGFGGNLNCQSPSSGGCDMMFSKLRRWRLPRCDRKQAH